MTDQHMAARSGVGGQVTKTMAVCPGSGQFLRDSRCSFCGQYVKANRQAKDAIDSTGLAARHGAPSWLRAREEA